MDAQTQAWWLRSEEKGERVGIRTNGTPLRERSQYAEGLKLIREDDKRQRNRRDRQNARRELRG